MDSIPCLKNNYLKCFRCVQFLLNRVANFFKKALIKNETLHIHTVLIRNTFVINTRPNLQAEADFYWYLSYLKGGSYVAFLDT